MAVPESDAEVEHGVVSADSPPGNRGIGSFGDSNASEFVAVRELPEKALRLSRTENPLHASPGCNFALCVGIIAATDYSPRQSPDSQQTGWT
jgi:hypothetical protein